MQENQAGDGTASGYLALPESETGPGVLVLHAWWGLVPTFTEVCDRLAAAGFVAYAPDLYEGRTAATVAEAEALQQATEASDPEHMRAIALAGLAYLREHPAVTDQAIGIVGFSMGTWWALVLNELQPDDIAAVVLFYGTGAADFSASRAAYLGHYAEHDEYEPLADVRALEDTIRAAGREVTFHIYPETGHWFFEADRPDAYDAAAARLAWERTAAFLHRVLG